MTNQKQLVSGYVPDSWYSMCSLFSNPIVRADPVKGPNCCTSIREKITASHRQTDDRMIDRCGCFELRSLMLELLRFILSRRLGLHLAAMPLIKPTSETTCLKNGQAMVGSSVWSNGESPQADLKSSLEVSIRYLTKRDYSVYLYHAFLSFIL